MNIDHCNDQSKSSQGDCGNASHSSALAAGFARAKQIMWKMESLRQRLCLSPRARTGYSVPQSRKSLLSQSVGKYRDRPAAITSRRPQNITRIQSHHHWNFSSIQELRNKVHAWNGGFWTRRQIHKIKLAYYRSLYDITSRGSEDLQQATHPKFLLGYMDHLEQNRFRWSSNTSTPVRAVSLSKPNSATATLLTAINLDWWLFGTYRSIVSKYNFEREISVLQKHPSKNVHSLQQRVVLPICGMQKNTVKNNTSKGSILTGTKMVDDNQTYWIIGNDQGEVTVFSEEGRQLSQKKLVRVCVLFLRIKVL